MVVWRSKSSVEHGSRSRIESGEPCLDLVSWRVPDPPEIIP